MEYGREVRLKDVVLSGLTQQGTIRVRLVNGLQESAKDVTFSFSNSTPSILPPATDGNSLYEVQGGSSRDPVIHLEPNGTHLSSHAVSGVGSYRAWGTWKDANGNSVRASVTVEFTGFDMNLDLIFRNPDGRLSCRVMIEDSGGVLSPLERGGVMMADAAGTSVNCSSPLRAGEHKLVGFLGIPGEAYVASARQGTRDAFVDGIDVTTEGSVLEVRVRRGAGISRGIVTDNQGRSVHDALVAAISDVAQPYPSSRTDQNGAFEIRGLRPGTYRLFAWSVVENQALRDPEFLQKFEDKGTVITARESEAIFRNLTILDGLK